jgi:hypothetical protein
MISLAKCSPFRLSAFVRQLRSFPECIQPVPGGSDVLRFSTMSKRYLYPLTLTFGAVILSGCRSPFDPVVSTDELQRNVRAAIEREFQELPSEQRWFETQTQPSLTEQALADRRDELDALTPALRERQRNFELGLDLTGRDQAELAMSLEDAVQAAVRQNLAVQIARLQPAITLQDVLAAEAAFDAVFFADIDFTRIDQQTTVPVLEPAQAPKDAATS